MTRPLSLADLVGRSCRFLLRDAKAENGFYSQNVGVGRGATPATANAILALDAVGRLSDGERENLLNELFTFQYSAQAKYAYSFCTEEVSSNWSTAKAVYAVLQVAPERASESRVVYALDWLLEHRNADGGWGYRKNDPSRPYYTYFAVQALCRAWSSVTDVKLRSRYENALVSVDALLASSRGSDGLWSNGEGIRPCPVNTLMAIAAARSSWPVVQRASTDWEDGTVLEFIRGAFMSPERWESLTWDEPGIAFKRIEPFPPGKIDTILHVFDPYDDLVVYLIGWIRRNAIEHGQDAVGWQPPQSTSKTPYSWSTARCLLSLAGFQEAVQTSVRAGRKQPAEVPRVALGERWQVVDRRAFMWVLYGYALLFTLLYVAWIARVVRGAVESLLSQAFRFIDLADFVGSVFLWVFPVVLLWAFTLRLAKKGSVRPGDVFASVKRLLSRSRPD